METASLGLRENTTQLLVIKVVVFIAFFAMSLPYTILPDLFLHSHIEHLSLLNHFSKKTVIMIAISGYPLGMFIGTYTLGVASDKAGKRNILLISLVMTALAQLACGFCVIDNRLLLLIFFRFVCGFFEGNISIARASIAIICPKEELRKYHLGQANIALTLGWIMGPPIGAILTRNSLANSFELPFFFGSILVFVALFFCYHSFSEPISSGFNGSEKEKIEKLQAFSIKIIMAVLASFIVFLGVDSFYVFIPIFLTLSLNATPTMLAFTSMTVGISNVLSNYFILPRIHRLINTKNTIILCANCLGVLLVLLSIFGSSRYSIILLPFFGASIALISPSIFTYISLRLSDNKQGALMGILSSQRTLGTAIISLFFAILINIKITLPFLFGCVFLFVGSVFFYLI